MPHFRDAIVIITRDAPPFQAFFTLQPQWSTGNAKEEQSMKLDSYQVYGYIIYFPPANVAKNSDSVGETTNGKYLWKKNDKSVLVN